jgi:hypothetical protein
MKNSPFRIAEPRAFGHPARRPTTFTAVSSQALLATGLIAAGLLATATPPAGAAIQLLGQYNTTGSAFCSAVSSDNGTLFVADWSQTLQVLNVGDPANPALITTFDASSNAGWIVLSADGTCAYIASDGQGLLIVDISNPAGPSLLGQSNPAGDAYAVRLSSAGTRAFVAYGSQGFRIIDVSTPSSPAQIGHYDTGGTSYDVALSADENRAYVADYDQGLIIIDISNPASPAQLGAYNTNGSAVAVCLSGDGTKAYVADMGAGLKIIDVSNPAAPFQRGSYTRPGSYNAYGVTLSGDGSVAFVAYGSTGLNVVDVTNPASPVSLEEFDPPGSGNSPARHICVSPGSGSTAYMSNTNQGIYILDISDYAVVAKEAIWHFEDGAGQTATDSSGNDHHGRLGSSPGSDSADPAWVEGWCGGTALEFDGNDYVDIGNDMSHLSGFTVTAWVKPSLIATDKQIISKGFNGTYTQWELKTTSSSGRVSFRSWQTGVGAIGVQSNQTLAVDQWTHLAGVYDGSQWKIYFNGELDNTAAAAGPTATTQRILIGAVDANGTASQYWRGVIDEVYIFDRVLGDSEIESLAACGMSIVKWREVIH